MHLLHLFFLVAAGGLHGISIFSLEYGSEINLIKIARNAEKRSIDWLIWIDLQRDQRLKLIFFYLKLANIAGI